MSSRIVYTPSQPPLKLKRPSRGVLFTLGAITLLILTATGLAYLLRLPQFQIADIEISGNRTLSSEDIKTRTLRFLEGNYMFLIPKSSLAAVSGEHMEHFLRGEFSKIESIDVSKEFPDKLILDIKEREIWGIFCNDLEAVEKSSQPDSHRVDTICVYVDRTGFSYEKAPNSSGALIVKIRSDVEKVPFPSQILDQAAADYMQFLASKLWERLNLEVIGYELFSKIPREIRVVTNSGFKIYFSRDGDLEAILEVLNTVLEEEIKDKKGRLEYIDARFGNKVFYKLKKN